MKNLQSLKAQQEIKADEVIKNSDMFFAFSNEQFAANKTPLQDGDKYVAIGAGAYLPKSKVDTYLNGMEAIRKWYSAQIKANKLRKKEIIYQLGNYECWYTGDIDDALDALGSDYTREEVQAIYNSEYKRQTQDM